MPEEIEVPTEHLHETMHEAADHESGPSWIPQVALSAAVLAVAAAIAALLAGSHANEAMLEQMKATDQWALYQAKGIKRSQIKTKVDILEAVGKKGSEDEGEIKRYETEQKDIEEKAKELEHSSAHHMHRHEVMARAVTGFQVAIALSAISVLSKKKLVWFLSLALGAIGTVFFVQSLLL